MSREDLYELERRHISTFFSQPELDSLSWQQGPIQEAMPRWRVLRARPRSRSNPWMYFTHGAFEATDDHHAFEFFVMTDKRRDDACTELLAMLTFYYADRRTGVNVGRVLSIGWPWVKGSRLDHVLISLPHPFGPAFEDLVCDGRHIRYLWALPITSAEAGLAEKSGLEALESAFETHRIDVIDPQRKSVV